MKRIIIFLVGVICILLCSSCKDEQKYEQNHFVYLDESGIIGQLWATANPFNPDKDTILCLKSIEFVYCLTYDSAYCSYLTDLFSKFEGQLFGCRFHPSSPHGIEFCPTSEMLFYPIANGEFVSITSTQTGYVLDSVVLNGTTIFTKSRKDTSDNVSYLYIEDYVAYQGNDHMRPKFITDSITPSGEQIICFDGTHGPIMAFQSIGGEIIDF